MSTKKRESDTYSTSSAASKGSRDKPKGSRFSIARLSFFSRRQSTSAKSMRSLRSVQSEPETRSLSSIPSVANPRQEDGISTSTAGGAGAGHLMECPLCLSQQAAESFPMLSTCHHRSCADCLRQYLRIEIMESRVNIACPECSEKFHPNDIGAIVQDQTLMAKYEEFMMRRVLVAEPDVRWCPAPDCSYAVIASGCASCPMLTCERPGCSTLFCYHCKQHWHPNQTCDSARAERSANANNQENQSEFKSCPRCSAFIIKMDDGSCNHMTCAVCGAEFCWLCMKEISDLHYLSPSGCTFWGKKPWTRKKKILWQLGTLVGAPVGIGLVAGIAVPAMIIGIPVWVGRKLHTKYQLHSKHKRNLIITGGVSASVILSPVLAGLAVGIGVPILLAYVYGVVPISLCRSGGCGVTTDSGGVRFEFEEDNEVTVGVSGPFTAPDSQSADAASHNLANPSIGPSIGEMSMGMTNSLSASGSHMDRVGLLRDGDSDRDSASNRALIGASLSGSLSGSAVAGLSGFQNRLEVQADVTNTASSAKRNSLSSESANFSLDARSATVSFCDNASTKALAGSICTRDKDNDSAVMPPLEVQVDMVASSCYRQGSEDSGTVNVASVGAEGSRVPTSPGSPASTRSVNFLGEEIIGEGPVASRTKWFARHSMSIGEHINDHAKDNSERMSIRSYTDEDCRLESAMKKPSRRDSKGATTSQRNSATSFDAEIIGKVHLDYVAENVPIAEGGKTIVYIEKSILQEETSTDPADSCQASGKRSHNHSANRERSNSSTTSSALAVLTGRRSGSKRHEHGRRRRQSHDQAANQGCLSPKIA